MQPCRRALAGVLGRNGHVLQVQPCCDTTEKEHGKAGQSWRCTELYVEAFQFQIIEELRQLKQDIRELKAFQRWVLEELAALHPDLRALRCGESSSTPAGLRQM